MVNLYSKIVYICTMEKKFSRWGSESAEIGRFSACFQLYLYKQKSKNLEKGGSSMKQKYLSPELEVTVISAEDILAVSNEVEINGGEGLFD